MSALPLFWHDGAVGSGLTEDQRAPVIRLLAKTYDVTPLDSLTLDGLRPFATLILAQPRALAPVELVALDAWVRKGGRVLVFADPLLDWPSLQGPGTQSAAPPVSLLDPLLAHWGLRLDEAGPEAATPDLAGRTVAASSAGRWHRLAEDCVITDGGLRADCVIGKGRAILVADADVLDLRPGELQTQNNGTAILALLKMMGG